jgi:hypothetical protein
VEESGEGVHGMERSRRWSWSEPVEGCGTNRAMDSTLQETTTSVSVEEPGEGGHDHDQEVATIMSLLECVGM